MSACRQRTASCIVIGCKTTPRDLTGWCDVGSPTSHHPPPPPSQETVCLFACRATCRNQMVTDSATWTPSSACPMPPTPSFETTPKSEPWLADAGKSPTLVASDCSSRAPALWYNSDLDSLPVLKAEDIYAIRGSFSSLVSMAETLLVGTRLMAKYDGDLYPADVINVAKKRIAATVRHFVSYDDEWDSWLPVSVLKYKLLPMITKTTKLPMRVGFCGVRPGLRVQAKADGAWYAAEQTMQNGIWIWCS